MFGWKGDALQRAMDKSECFYDGCGSIKKQSMANANKCTVKDFVGENIDGCKFVPIRDTSIPNIADADLSIGTKYLPGMDTEHAPMKRGRAFEA